MLLKIISYSIIFLFSCGLFANEKTDLISHHKNIITSTKSDSIRLEHIIDLSWDYRNYNIDSAVYFSDWAIRLSKAVNQPKLLAKELDIRSSIMIIKGDLDSAEYYQMQALKLRRMQKNYRGLRSSYEEMGNVKKAKGHYELALNYYFRALLVIDSIPYKPEELKLYKEHNLEKVEDYYSYLRKNNFDMSKHTEGRTSVKFVHIANEKRLIGEIYLLKKDYENAQKYLSEALVLNYHLLDADQIIMNEFALANLYMETEKEDKAKLHTSMALGIAKHKVNYSDIAKSFRYLSKIEQAESNYSKALAYLDSAKYFHFQFARDTNNFSLEIRKFRILIDSLSSAPSINLTDTIINITNSLYSNLVSPQLTLKNKLSLYQGLYEFYNLIGQDDSALTYQTQYYLLKDSLIGLESQNRLSELMEIHESKKKSKTIQLQAKQIINYTELLWLSAALILIVILFAIYMIYSNRKMKKLHSDVLNLNRLLTESTKNKEQLFSYIAHDLRGPLTSSGSVIKLLLENSLTEEKKAKYIAQLGQTIHKSEQFTDNLIHWAKTKSGTIKPILKPFSLELAVNNALQNFEHEIEEKQLTVTRERTTITLETDAILFQAIINNLIQNAVRYSEKNSDITISPKQDINNWSLSITNIGKTISPTTIQAFNDGEITHNETGNGIGLTIIKHYSKLLNLACKIESGADSSTFTLSNK